MSERILVACDQAFERGLLCELCQSAGYQTVIVSDAEGLTGAMRREAPNLVLLDAAIGGGRGFDLARQVKGDAALGEVPVLIVTDGEDRDARMRALELGVEDSITRPIRIAELEQRVRSAMRTREYRRQLQEARGRLDELDTMDPATRVGNYQRLRLTLEYEFLRAARYGHPLSCVIVRVESAKSGEGVAEPLLVEIVDRLKASLRGADLLFRFDAERFAVLLPETDGSGARSAVQRMILSLRTGEAIVASRRRLLLGAASYPQPAVATYDALVRGALSAADRAAARSETPFAASE